MPFSQNILYDKNLEMMKASSSGVGNTFCIFGFGPAINRQRWTPRAKNEQIGRKSEKFKKSQYSMVFYLL
jgi:hypothetical protein